MRDRLQEEYNSDLSAIAVYMRMGYSIKEVREAFCKVFLDPNNPEQVARYEKISAFIENFNHDKLNPGGARTKQWEY